MLTSKNKDKNRKKKDDHNSDDDTILSMRSWVRKIEQSANSLSSRLSAVEKRISRGTNSDNSFLTVETSVGSSISKALADIQSADDNDFEELLKILGNELAVIREELASQQNEISLFNEKVEGLNDLLGRFKEEITKTREAEENFFKDIEARVGRIENRAPPTMKLGRMEVPVEIAGVIAGGIAIIAAFFVMINQQSILISPGFLAVVGIVFIGAALLKSVRTVKANDRTARTAYKATLYEQ